MAAPENTVWGSIINSRGRIGIYTSTSSTNTVTNVTVEVWFWSKYSCTDSANTFYFSNDATEATTGRGSVTINTSVNSSWSTSNQVKIGTYSYSYARATTTKSVYCAAKLTGIDWVNGTMTVSTSYSIPALASYSVAYNANGGNGAPASQTKYYDIDLTLSSTKPTRTGYTFNGWATSSTATTSAYNPGATYTGNAALSLFAVWAANTFTVSYNANGGSGAPGNQTKTYGTALTLSGTIPTRTNYNFLGWGTSASATSAAYLPGASYTAEAAVTLYAVWELAYSEPTISELSVSRCASDGTADDFGTYAEISFSWACDQTQGSNAVTAIKIRYKETSASTWATETVSASGTSGTVNKVIGAGGLSVDASYAAEISVSDSMGGTTALTRTIASAAFPIDFLTGGKGVAFGKPATKENVAEFEFEAEFNNGATFGGKSIIDMIYPVGCIYISYDTTSPAEIFGGSWHRIESRFLYGCAAEGTTGLTGGEATHTLTEDEMPSHNHLIYDNSGSGSTSAHAWSTTWKTTYSGSMKGSTIGWAGGSKAHNNMPPYVNVAIWRRTA